MIRVGELTYSQTVDRKKIWLEVMSLPLEWVDFSDEQKGDTAQILKATHFDALILSADFSANFLSSSARIPAETNEAGFADSLVRSDGKLWLRCYLREAMRRLILERAPKLDTHSICYVTGSSLLSSLCAVVAIQLGFVRIVFIAEDPIEAQERAANLQRLYFGLELKIIRDTELTLQPNNGSLLLNTFEADGGSLVFEDLTYLNFLRKDGLVIDLPFAIQENSLLAEAKHVGVRCVSGLELWARRDYLFLKALLPEWETSWESYLATWNAQFSEEKQT